MRVPSKYAGDTAFHLIQAIKDRAGLATYGEVAALLGTSSATISKLRSGEQMVTDEFIVVVNERADMPVDEIKRLLID